MTRPDPAQIRAELARGHLLLGELEPAHACLARVVADAPTHPELEPLLRSLVEECEVGAPELLPSARALYEQLRPPTPPDPEPIENELDAPEASAPIAPIEVVPAGTEDPEPIEPQVLEPAPPARARPDAADRARIARLEAWLESVHRRYGTRSCA